MFTRFVSDMMPIKRSRVTISARSGEPFNLETRAHLASESALWKSAGAGWMYRSLKKIR